MCNLLDLRVAGGGCGWQLSQSQQMAGGADSSGSSFYGTADTVFAALFTAELLVNMAANLFCPFFRDPWNWFDTVRGQIGGWDRPASRGTVRGDKAAMLRRGGWFNVVHCPCPDESRNALVID